jgi:hypothetical protein
VIKQIKEMFETIGRKGEMGEGEWKERMRGHREKILRRATGTVPGGDEARLIAGRLERWEEEYFRFIEAGIEATNNPAELTIRQSILDRIITQGSRGIAGTRWHERFWTVFATCTMQDISVMNYLRDCISAYFGIGSFPNIINIA